MSEYVTLDPRAEGYTLEDAKHEEERRRRKGQIPSAALPGSKPPGESRDSRNKGGVRSRGYAANTGVERDWRGQTEDGRKSSSRPDRQSDDSWKNEPRPSASGGW